MHFVSYNSVLSSVEIVENLSSFEFPVGMMPFGEKLFQYCCGFDEVLPFTLLVYITGIC